MIQVSNAYKEAMERPLRNRGFMKVVLGLINQFAQGSASVIDTEQASWSSNTSLFEDKQLSNEYATMEQNFFKVDGSMNFMALPVSVTKEESVEQYLDTGFISKDFNGRIKIKFDEDYEFRGLTIDFGSTYPTLFRIITDSAEFEFECYSSEWSTTQYLGFSTTLTIVPIEMLGGTQRLHIRAIKMGVGITFDNNNIQSASLQRSVSTISEDIPSDSFSLTAIDPTNQYNVDSQEAFINFFQTKQKVEVFYGQTLDNDEVEYLKIGQLYLDNWSSSSNSVKITAKDIFTFMDDEYTLGNQIYERSAYFEAEQILRDAGLMPDEYVIDDSLRSIQLVNPIEPTTHKEALQLVANASRCIMYQNVNGTIVVAANFEQVIDPEDLTVVATEEAEWSTKDQIRFGGGLVYVDMSSNMFSVDGSMIFMPQDGDYKQSGYYSKEISDENGLFEVNPSVGIQLEAAFVYYGVQIDFGSRPPKEIKIKTFSSESPVETFTVKELTQSNFIYHEFKSFDKMIVEIVRHQPNSRVMVGYMTFGDVSDYLVSKNEMLNSLVGYREARTKNVFIGYTDYSEQYDDDGNIVIDEETGLAKYEKAEPRYVRRQLNATGKNVYLDNPLIDNEDFAEVLSEWIGNYYSNDVSYDVQIRGDARLQPADLVHLESDVLSNLIVEINELNLTFSGGLKETLKMRKALKMINN